MVEQKARKKRKKSTKAQKPPNGQGQSGSYLLVFDLDDDAQAKAWVVAQQLASQRKLKHVLVAVLLAVHTVQEHTGRAVDMLQFSGAFIANLIRGDHRPAFNDFTEPEELPMVFAGTDDHADPALARQNFTASMGNLFDDDDDEDW